jgi:hypothetical protein
MTRAELTEKQKQEQEEWRQRGVSGVVSAVDATAGTFTIKTGPQTLTVQPGESASYYRYAPDSFKFSDATPSTLAEIQAGDQVRLLGEKSADGASIAAGSIVSGSFPQFAATIRSVNAEKSEIVIRDLVSKKDLSVRITPDSTIKRLPPPVAAGLAKRYGPSPGPAQRPAPAAAPPTGASAAPDRADAGIAETLAGLPSLAVTDLKPGDAVMLSSTRGSDPGRVTAIMLLAGVEPLLTASPTATRDILGVWNLSGF